MTELGDIFGTGVDQGEQDRRRSATKELAEKIVKQGGGVMPDQAEKFTDQARWARDNDPEMFGEMVRLGWVQNEENSRAPKLPSGKTATWLRAGAGARVGAEAYEVRGSIGSSQSRPGAFDVPAESDDNVGIYIPEVIDRAARQWDKRGMGSYEEYVGRAMQWSRREGDVWVIPLGQFERISKSQYDRIEAEAKRNKGN